MLDRGWKLSLEPRSVLQYSPYNIRTTFLMWRWFSFCPDLLTPEGVLWYQEVSSRSFRFCGRFCVFIWSGLWDRTTSLSQSPVDQRPATLSPVLWTRTTHTSQDRCYTLEGSTWSIVPQ